MNNQSLIFIRNLATLITFPILFIFAFLIILQGSVESSPFPGWQPFTIEREINFIGTGAIWARSFFFSQEQNPNWLGQRIEFFSSVSPNSQSITNEKANQTSNKRYSNYYEYIISHFEILVLIGLVSFLIGLILGLNRLI